MTAAAGEAESQSCSVGHGAPAQVPSHITGYHWIANAQIHGPRPTTSHAKPAIPTLWERHERASGGIDANWPDDFAGAVGGVDQDDGFRRKVPSRPSLRGRQIAADGIGRIGARRGWK